MRSFDPISKEWEAEILGFYFFQVGDLELPEKRRRWKVLLCFVSLYANTGKGTRGRTCRGLEQIGFGTV